MSGWYVKKLLLQHRWYVQVSGVSLSSPLHSDLNQRLPSRYILRESFCHVTSWLELSVRISDPVSLSNDSVGRQDRSCKVVEAETKMKDPNGVHCRPFGLTWLCTKFLHPWQSYLVEQNIIELIPTVSDTFVYPDSSLDIWTIPIGASMILAVPEISTCNGTNLCHVQVNIYISKQVKSPQGRLWSKAQNKVAGIIAIHPVVIRPGPSR